MLIQLVIFHAIFNQSINQFTLLIKIKDLLIGKVIIMKLFQFQLLFHTNDTGHKNLITIY